MKTTKKKLVRDSGCIPHQNVRSVLVFELLSIGGSLLISPVLRHLKYAFPKSRLTLVTYPASEPLYRENPYVDRIILYRPGWGSLPALWKLLWRQYDVALDFLCNTRSLIVLLCAGARYRIGMDTNARNVFYTHVADRSGDPYVAAFNLRYLHAFNLFPDDVSLDLEVAETAGQRIDAYVQSLPKQDYLIGISPTGNWYTKKWPEEKFAALCDMLNKQYRCNILLIWGPGEKPVVEKVAALCKTPVVITPATDLLELAALIDRLDVLITNDSANKHIAVARKTPTVTVYGATRPASWEPPTNPRHLYFQRSDIHCVPCDRTSCQFQLECLQRIHADDVMQLIALILEKESG